MSYGTFVHASKEERRQHDRRIADAAAAQRRRAAAWVAEHLPDLTDDRGRPCGYAVYAALRLKAQGGAITPQAVRQHRSWHRMFDGRTLGEWERDEAREAGPS